MFFFRIFAVEVGLYFFGYWDAIVFLWTVADRSLGIGGYAFDAE